MNDYHKFLRSSWHTKSHSSQDTKIILRKFGNQYSLWTGYNFGRHKKKKEKNLSHHIIHTELFVCYVLPILISSVKVLADAFTQCAKLDFLLLLYVWLRYSAKLACVFSLLLFMLQRSRKWVNLLTKIHVL